MEWWIKYSKRVSDGWYGNKGQRLSEPDLRFFDNQQDMDEFIKKLGNDFKIVDRSKYE